MFTGSAEFLRIQLISWYSFPSIVPICYIPLLFVNGFIFRQNSQRTGNRSSFVQRSCGTKIPWNAESSVQSPAMFYLFINCIELFVLETTTTGCPGTLQEFQNYLIPLRLRHHFLSQNLGLGWSFSSAKNHPYTLKCSAVHFMQCESTWFCRQRETPFK